MKSVLLLCLVACACAGSKPKDAPPATELTVLDEAGQPIQGEISLWSHAVDDTCTQNDKSCDLELPSGDYTLTFRKLRAGRVGSSIGSEGGGMRNSGCLRARVKMTAGKKIVCKKRAEFNCAKGAVETMDCGEAAATRYGYTPRPEDIPSDQP